MKNISIIFLFVLAVFAEKTFAQWTCCDTVSFETPTSNIVIDTLSGNLWQIAKPDKTFFNSAHSGTNAILTDSIYTYPPNDTSSFIHIIHNPYLQTCYTCISFWHKYDTDTLADYGIVDASYDGGNSWFLLNDSTYFFDFHWNSDYHESTGNYTKHNLVTSGQSDGWIQSTFCWQWYIVVKTDTIISPPDSLMVRFTFISDSIVENRDGWIIDDIIVNATDPVECYGGFDEMSKENHISVFPNPFIFQTTLQTNVFLKNATLTLYNSLGQKSKQINNITGQTITLRRNNLLRGLYYIQLSQDNKTVATGKLVVSDN